MPAVALGQSAAGAGTFLPQSHWSRSAIRRLSAAGLLDLHVSALPQPERREQVALWFDSAHARALRTGAAGQVAVVELYREMLDREISPAGANNRFLSLRVGVAVGAELTSGELRAGTMLETPSGYQYPGPVPLRDRSDLVAKYDATVRLLPSVALGLAGGSGTRDDPVLAPYLSARLAGLDVWAGRRGFALGSVPHESVVLNHENRFDGIGLSLRNGFRVPLFGQAYPEIILARMERSGAIRHPYFLANRITLAPARNLTIGLNRAAIFGGEDNITITPARIVLMLFGFTDTALKDSDFENQVASFDLLWRVAARSTPILLYTEMGADDAGSFLRVPSIMLGMELLFRPELALGLEALHIAERCCSFPPWYQHGALADGWTDRGRLLGHSLGGAGNELALSAETTLPSLPLVGSGRFYARHRAAENLFAPDHKGISAGISLDVLIPWRSFQFRARGELEHGSGWQHSHGSFRVAAFF